MRQAAPQVPVSTTEPGPCSIQLRSCGVPAAPSPPRWPRIPSPACPGLLAGTSAASAPKLGAAEARGAPRVPAPGGTAPGRGEPESGLPLCSGRSAPGPQGCRCCPPRGSWRETPRGRGHPHTQQPGVVLPGGAIRSCAGTRRAAGTGSERQPLAALVFSVLKALGSAFPHPPALPSPAGLHMPAPCGELAARRGPGNSLLPRTALFCSAPSCCRAFGLPPPPGAAPGPTAP